MKDNSVKLSGYAKDRFIERFFAEEAAVDEELRAHLVAKGKSTFTSVRVRKTALVRRPASSLRTSPPGAVTAPLEAAPAPQPDTPRPPAKPHGASVKESIEAPLAPAKEAQAPPADAAFDPYVFGLVPIFQREGADGLLAKLATVERIEHLRAMARSQQIVLPQELRTGDASADAVRAGIVDGVAKRIKDRRAAAG